MSTDVRTTYALNIRQCADLIKANGKEHTLIIQGDIGSGKSSILTLLKEDPDLANHRPIYLDGTVLDLGDLFIPNFKSLETGGVVEFAPNEHLGLHETRPVILMIDEFGKANPAVKNGLLRLMYERQAHGRALPEGSLVFATTNLGAEGVGDLLPPHARNRMSVVTMRKPNEEEMIEYGINNGWHAAILGWIKENPQLLHSFRDYENPSDNPYIFHPKEQRDAFVSPRSLECASDILHHKDEVDQDAMTAALIGAIGGRGALDLAAFVELDDQLPRLDDIKTNPKKAKVPKGASGVCMIVYKVLTLIERDWMDAWMEYMGRLNTEAQAMFAQNVVRNDGYRHRAAVLSNKRFRDWAIEHNYLYGKDVEKAEEQE